MRSKVVVVKSRYNNIYEKLSSVLDVFAWPELKKCNVISIKINLCDARTPDTGAITHPLFLDALLKYIRDKCGYSVTINIVESDASVALPDLFIKWFGFIPTLKKWEAKYVNLSKDGTIQVKLAGNFLNRLNVPRTIADTDYFISLAKLKTNNLTKISCCLKNQFGCLPIKKKNVFHPFIDDVIADVNAVMKPDFCIVDGIIAHVTTKGPAFGKPVPANMFIAGNDPVSVDSYCAKVLGFHPYFIRHIRKAAEAGVGNMRHYDIIVKGFSKAPHINSEFSLFDYYLGKFASIISRKNRLRWRRGSE
jgi:uncharacterized protein (DUF362 family)